VPNDSLYIYSENGYWQRFHSDYVELHALEEIEGDAIRSAHLTDIRRLVEKLSLIGRHYPDRCLNDHNGHCNIRSGMLHLETLNIKDHHKDFLSTIQLPVNYNSNAKYERFLQFLNEIFEDDSERIAIVQEFTGLCLVPDTSFQKALIMVGEGANGKTTLIQVLEELLGRDNISSVALADLGNEFHRVRLHGKLVNIASEIDPKTLEKSDYFKSIVTGDTISAAHKHKPAFDYRPVARLIFACNRLPRVRDTSHGFYRRLMILPFERRFEGDNADRHLKHRLLAELDGIFLWAIRGLKRLYQQGHFTDSEMVDKALSEYKRYNNPLMAFIEDSCKLDPTANSPKQTLYSEYRSYCEDYGYSAFSKGSFFRELYATYPQLEPMRIRQENEREQVVMGIVVVKRI
jgi:putative DNA primase/helicase